MPVYEYACMDCSEKLEVRQSFTDDSLTVCPACEGRLRKILSAVGVVFKGSGFYRNDSRPVATGSESDSSPGEAKQDAASAAKPSEPKGSKESGEGTTSSSDGDAKKSAKADGGAVKGTPASEKSSVAS